MTTGLMRHLSSSCAEGYEEMLVGIQTRKQLRHEAAALCASQQKEEPSPKCKLRQAYRVRSGVQHDRLQ